MTHTSDRFDVIVIGGGPAGCAAARAARQHDLTTLLVEQSASPIDDPRCPGWISPAAARALEHLDVTAATTRATPFNGLRLHNWTLDDAVDVHDPELTGWIVDPPHLRNTLQHTATDAGATVRVGITPATTTLGEGSATLRFPDNTHVTGRVLLIADGAQSQLASAVQLRAAWQYPPPGSAAACALTQQQDSAGLDVFVGARPTLRIATLVRHGPRARLWAYVDEASDAATVLDDLVARLHAAHILDTDNPQSATPIPALNGVALEMDTHVGKRCALIGDAGGFAAAFSGESLFPALRSGWLAGETAARALRADVFQDEWATFSAAWQADLAEYLRRPSTDLSLLLPMIFKNPQMSGRVARAFLLGSAF